MYMHIAAGEIQHYITVNAIKDPDPQHEFTGATELNHAIFLNIAMLNASLYGAILFNNSIVNASVP